jgi:hypothetical protein
MINIPVNNISQAFQIALRSIIFPLLLLPLPILAQDQNGNYYRNESPVQATIEIPSNRGLQAGSLWRVMVDALNCRREASLNSPVVKVYNYGDILEVEVYRGGSDEVFINAIDENNQPWMPVRGDSYQARCLVRANSRLIAPVTR